MESLSLLNSFIVKIIISFLLQAAFIMLNPNMYHGRDAYNALNTLLLRICIKHIRIFQTQHIYIYVCVHIYIYAIALNLYHFNTRETIQ